MVRTGVMRAYGGDLRHLIGLGMQRRMLAFAVGLGVTGVLQSSTATALMTASFAERGLVALAPALAVMLGADVGTAVVAQVLSLKIDWIWPLLVLIGVTAFSVAGVTRRRDLGRAVIGLGLMLLALQLIVQASAPIRDSVVVHEVFMALAGEPLIALLLAAALTWLTHSSLAVVLLVMSLASVGMVPLAFALALVLGANVGGAIPAVVATWRGESAARRITLGNLGFRAIGCLICLPLIGLIAPLVAFTDGEAGRQVVNFHLAFNIALAILFLPLLGLVAPAARRILPDRPPAPDEGAPRYLDPAAIESPALAIAAAARETLRMGDTLEKMLADTMTVFRTDDRKLAGDIERRDDIVDRLHEAIKLYLTGVTREALSEADGRRCMDIIAFTTNLEHIGDIIDKNLMELAVKKIKNRLQFSEQGLADIAELHARTLSNLKLALAVFMSNDPKMARQLLEQKVVVRDFELNASDRHLARLRSGVTVSIETSSVHLDILRDLKRINSHLTAVVYPILEQTGELAQSRLRQSEPVEAPDRAAVAADQPRHHPA